MGLLPQQSALGICNRVLSMDVHSLYATGTVGERRAQRSAQRGG